MSNGLSQRQLQCAEFCLKPTRRIVAVTGQAGTGKTTLMEALLPLLPELTIVVERAPELRIPDAMPRLAAIPPSSEQTPIATSFCPKIQSADDAIATPSRKLPGSFVTESVTKLPGSFRYTHFTFSRK